MGILRLITDAQIASAAVYPSSPYTGTLPSKAVKKGSKGNSVKSAQRFLNWCIKAGLSVDGSCGPKTVSAIKKFQKQYKLKVDGCFGPQSKKKAQQIIAKYAPKPAPAPAPQPAPKPTPAPAPTPAKTWVDNANAWAKKIAADNSYHYVKWNGNVKKTQECPICHHHPKGKYHGWNCIGFSWAVWHHGGKIPCKCNCHVIDNGTGNKMYRVSSAQALAIAKKKSGLTDLKVIRKKGGIPKSEWKAGDICLQFSGSKYVHSFYYMGSGKICDAIGSSGKVPNDKQIAVRSYKKYSAKIIIRYTGK